MLNLIDITTYQLCWGIYFYRCTKLEDTNSLSFSKLVSSHISKDIINYLTGHVSESITPEEWLPRIPNSNSLDYSVSFVVEQIFSRECINNVKHLKTRITQITASKNIRIGFWTVKRFLQVFHRIMNTWSKLCWDWLTLREIWRFFNSLPFLPTH